MVVPLWLLFASTSSSSSGRRRIETNPTHQDGFVVRALDPALKGRVRRAPDQMFIGYAALIDGYRQILAP